MLTRCPFLRLRSRSNYLVYSLMYLFLHIVLFLSDEGGHASFSPSNSSTSLLRFFFLFFHVLLIAQTKRTQDSVSMFVIRTYPSRTRLPRIITISYLPSTVYRPIPYPPLALPHRDSQTAHSLITGNSPIALSDLPSWASILSFPIMCT